MRTVLLLGLLTAASAFAESAGGLTWTAPKAWKAEGARGMRAASYQIPPAKGAKEGGELAVFYFGPNEGGGVQANIDRWLAQFDQPSGKSSKDVAKISKQQVGGFPATIVDLTGTYNAAAGPMAPTKVVKPGYRLLGAIVQGPQGAVFFKFTGPEKTVAANKKDFEKMLKSISKSK